MTDQANTPADEMKVEQRHRDAAAELIELYDPLGPPRMRQGIADTSRAVQAFARFERDHLTRQSASTDAMREPTEAMLDAAWKQTGESKEMRLRVHARMRRYWQAMWDARTAIQGTDHARS